MVKKLVVLVVVVVWYVVATAHERHARLGG